MFGVEESSSVESKPLASLDSTYEPSPKPRTPKERLGHPSVFPIKFEDYGNTSKVSQHEKHTHPPEVSPRAELSKEWLMEVKCSSEAIHILLPSMTIPCSLREMWQNHPNYLAHMHLSLSLRPLTAAHES